MKHGLEIQQKQQLMFWQVLWCKTDMNFLNSNNFVCFFAQVADFVFQPSALRPLLQV